MSNDFPRLSRHALDLINKTQEDGDRKYGGAFNWRTRKTSAQMWIDGMRRHLDAYEAGNDTDGESGYNHLTHLAARCIIVLDAIECSAIIDDRGTP